MTITVNDEVIDVPIDALLKNEVIVNGKNILELAVERNEEPLEVESYHFFTSNKNSTGMFTANVDEVTADFLDMIYEE